MAGCLPVARFIWVLFALLGRHYLGPGSVGQWDMFRIPRLITGPNKTKQNQQNKPALKITNRRRWCLIRGGRGLPFNVTPITIV